MRGEERREKERRGKAMRSFNCFPFDCSGTANEVMWCRETGERHRWGSQGAVGDRRSEVWKVATGDGGGRIQTPVLDLLFKTQALGMRRPPPKSVKSCSHRVQLRALLLSSTKNNMYLDNTDHLDSCRAEERELGRTAEVSPLPVCPSCPPPTPSLSFLMHIFETNPVSNCTATHHLPATPPPALWSGAYQDPVREGADYAGSCQPSQSLEVGEMKEGCERREGGAGKGNRWMDGNPFMRRDEMLEHHHLRAVKQPPVW
ncbi:unnamed protein product [Pleuronectes platessa]|uniref:Uncharacterized protein n=1 Tax=Pleuronectes platessa TaxID=8262 RepID=A0A9N7VNM5_PLEPL|nr:unnamed protein product [Pleuronectes platessa]